MKATGGFFLPNFIKKGLNTWFAIDNIDLLEDTPTGQGTFHGTVAVMFQQDRDGELINQPLEIPEKLHTQKPLAIDEIMLQEPIIRNIPLRFPVYEIGQRKNLLSEDYTHTWALANYQGTDDGIDMSEDSTEAPMGQSHSIDVQGDHEDCQDDSTHVETPAGVREQPPGKLLKTDVMPTWAATKSLLLTQSSSTPTCTNVEVIAPLVKTSPTDYGTLYTVLRLTQGISATVVGPQRKTLITLDLDLYSRALKIQQSVGETNWILRAGALHIAFAALHALGKTIDGSGLDTCAIESVAYTSAALRGIFGGKAYKRGIEYHITTSLAIMMMRFDVILSSLPKGQIRAQCSALKEKLHERNPNMTDDYEELRSWYAGNVKPLEQEKDIGPFAEFLLAYLDQVESLLHFVSSCCSGDWQRYLASLENLIKYFFARDLLNFARLMPVYLAQMNALEDDEPETWNALMSGDFVVAKSEIPFTHLGTDQALEQEIKRLKGHGGMVGLSRDDVALNRLVTTTPYLARIVDDYFESFPKAFRSSKRTEHYQLSGQIPLRSRENRHSIELHCAGNPFRVKTPLKSLVSSALVDKEAQDDILHFADKGEKRYDEFVSERLMTTSTLSVWDKMKKLKLKAFSNWMEKMKVRIGDKVIKLREERELLGRFLIVQGSRPELVPKLEETIGEYEMSTVPRSLCAVDGSLYIPTDKASLMHAIEDAIDATVESTGLSTAPADTEEEDLPVKALIIDAMGVLQSMKKTPKMLTISHLQDAFIERIEMMMANYQEGRVVFDRYLDQSLKNKTRQKRSTTSIEYEVHPEMKLTMSIKELLSSSKTKRKLTCLFGQGLLDYFRSKEDQFKLVVVYDALIKGRGFQYEHSHEEADTLIPNQVLASVACGPSRRICVWSPDTDVLLLLVDLVASGQLPSTMSLKFHTGKGKKTREIDVLERVAVIGTRKCQGLLGLHNFSGADWGGRFIGISKKSWVDAYLKVDDEDPAIDCFKSLGSTSIPAELDNNELPTQVKALEKFVCRVYSPKGPTTLPSLRWELFRSKNLEGEMLPPTRAALLPHITRANYITMRDKSYPEKCPTLPSIEENGWELEKGAYVPVRCLALPAPRAVVELVKCGCKSGCKGIRCSCLKNGLPCTPLCKCYGGDCENSIREDVSNMDIDE